MRALCLAFVAASSLIPSESIAQQHDVVVDDLRLELRVDHNASRLEGVAELRILNLGTEQVSNLPILLGRLMRVEGVADGIGPLSFAQDVVRFPDWDQMQVLETWTELREPLRPGDATSLTIHYEGTVVGYTETGMSYVRDRVAPEFTLIRSDAFSFPTLGEASLSSMRAGRPHDFTFSGSVSVEGDRLILASAGTQGVEPAEDGRRIWRFESEGPAPFLILAIAPYETLETPGATIYHFPGDRVGAQRLAISLASAEELYSEWFGPRADPRRITIMEIPEGWGSQASLAGGIIQTADAFQSGEALPQLYHELAHLWHPPETERPADRWNEGLATFLQWRVQYHLRPDSLAHRMNRVAARAVAQLPPDIPPMDAYGETQQTDLAYRVGAILFYLLYEVLGGEGFDECFRGLFSESAAGSTTADFDRVVGGCGPAPRSILDEWFSSTRGLERLRTGEPLTNLVATYRAAS